MSEEFPISNLEKRLFSGLCCSVCAMLLNAGLPLLLIKIGVDPKWPTQQGPLGGMGVGLILLAGIVFSGSIGLVAGLARPGKSAAMATLIGLAFEDVWMIILMNQSFWLYSISAAIKISLLTLIIWRDPKL